MRQTRTADRVRRLVDGAMIFAALLMLAWPVLFAERPDPLVPIGVVLLLGVGVILLAARWPLLQYAPVAAAVLMAAFWHAPRRRGLPRAGLAADRRSRRSSWSGSSSAPAPTRA